MQSDSVYNVAKQHWLGFVSLASYTQAVSTTFVNQYKMISKIAQVHPNYVLHSPYSTIIVHVQLGNLHIHLY